MLTSSLPSSPSQRFSLTLISLWFLYSEKLLHTYAIPQFDDELYNDLLNDPRAMVETLYTNIKGIITVRVTASISVVASILIIFLIFKSSSKLSTTYHRLVFGMSVADCIGSTSIALNTLPMPNEMIYQQFQSVQLGNSATCSAQGFLFMSGSMATFFFNTCLCIYYLCAIRYTLSEDVIKKRIEPYMYLVSITAPIIISSILLYFDFFVPSPWDYTCTAATYPYWCDMTSEDSIICPKDEIIIGERLRIIVLCGYMMCSFIIFSSLLLVWLAVRNRAKDVEYLIKNIYSGSSGTNNNLQNELNVNNGMTSNLGFDDNLSRHRMVFSELEAWEKEAKVVLIQALAYVGAFVMCQLFPFLSILVLRRNSPILAWFHVLLRPLQGLFNLLIFLGHKVYNYKRVSHDTSIWKAICLLLFNKSSDMEPPTIFFLNIRLVSATQNQDEPEHELDFSQVDDVGILSNGISSDSNAGGSVNRLSLELVETTPSSEIVGEIFIDNDYDEQPSKSGKSQSKSNISQDMLSFISRLSPFSNNDNISWDVSSEGIR
mmetsp:Transcript_27541/g.32129  ORF Transcript_27541/g.32129 Transcript_27541/m.32129 type:complete len:545 (+) Transcript_27541:525-2159(+)